MRRSWFPVVLGLTALTDVGSLTIRWQTRAEPAKARIRQTIGGRVVDFRAPAPSYY